MGHVVQAFRLAVPHDNTCVRNVLLRWPPEKLPPTVLTDDYTPLTQHIASVDLSQEVNATLWFSPNTRQKTKANDAPPDLTEVFDIIRGAKQSILFLAFQPGTPSIIEAIGQAYHQNRELFVRGAVTDPKAIDAYNVELFHRDGERPDATLVAASNIQDEFGFWKSELLKSSPGAHAIIHDKIVVVDPFSSDCVVVTGSHNLGHRASYQNDENLLILRGNRAVAEAYATHVLHVYDHYRFRYRLRQNRQKAWSGLEKADDWQDKYFENASDARKDLEFWSHTAQLVNI